jgi:DNA-binding transcriptional ArsR family regulator
MVQYPENVLDRTFAALADPTRRALVTRLTERSHSVSELAEPFAISLQAVIKHLDVLANAGLITREKTGRTVSCTLSNEPFERAFEWLDRHERAWHERFDRLDAYLERIQRGATGESKH